MSRLSRHTPTPDELLYRLDPDSGLIPAPIKVAKVSIAHVTDEHGVKHALRELRHLNQYQVAELHTYAAELAHSMRQIGRIWGSGTICKGSVGVRKT